MKQTNPRRKPKAAREYGSHELRQPPVDLFGDVVVTNDDLFDWVAAISPAHLHERAYALYVQRYDVAGKVRTAKLHGDFEALTARPGRPWHARLALHAIL
ncbi:hypothetical protein [Pseudoduganella namucuonensis]|uniref:Uncharacterized protein n=1 Tax=Pseudoduganella namucuonensis TaxID=1035707 RepID=A0A1I7M7G3_9BURK|nr:hypothetical protein [Pseudoduganella namucuonensis]SFV17888.1 hypothetical protein SAMN05216552_108010 [Pseudoduganella namucuonensis]